MTIQADKPEYGPVVDSYDIMQLITQIREHDDSDFLCVAPGGTFMRSWSNPDGEGAVISAHLFAPANGVNLCSGYGDWATAFTKLFFEWDYKNPDEGGYATQTGSVGSEPYQLDLQFAKLQSEITVRSLEVNFTLEDQSFVGTAESVKNSVSLIDLGIIREMERPSVDAGEPATTDLHDRANVNCGSITYDYRSNGGSGMGRQFCNCQGADYDVECSMFKSDDTTWTRTKLNAALLNLIAAIGSSAPAVGKHRTATTMTQFGSTTNSNLGQIIQSNPKGAVLTNGWDGTRNYRPKGDRSQSDCCRSAIQNLIDEVSCGCLR